MEQSNNYYLNLLDRASAGLETKGFPTYALNRVINHLIDYSHNLPEKTYAK